MYDYCYHRRTFNDNVRTRLPAISNDRPRIIHIGISD